MARLPPGVAPTPHKIRLRGYREDLKQRQGSRVSVDIEAEPTQALALIMERKKLNKREAVSEALISLAKSL